MYTLKLKSCLSLTAGIALTTAVSITQAATLQEVESNDTFATANTAGVSEAGASGTLVGSIGDITSVSQDVDIWLYISSNYPHFYCIYSLWLRRLATPTKPIMPLANNHAAAGTGTTDAPVTVNS